MKKFPIVALLALMLLAYACKSQPAAHAATVSTTSTPTESVETEASDTLEDESNPTIAKDATAEPYQAYPKPEGVSFEVSDVELPKKMLATFKPKVVLEQRIGKEVSYFADEKTGINLVVRGNNGLVQTIYESYASHRPLVLSPDAIWLTICQGVSIHVNQHFDSLEHVLFKKDKPKEIRVRNDDLEHSSDSWAVLAEQLTDETKLYTNNNLYSTFVPNFSSTTAPIRAAYHVTMLESFKQAFVYVGETGCGIPNITLRGTKQDWEWIYNHLNDLKQFGLGRWAENLKPIIKEFINVFDGNINKPFWQSIYKDASEYGAYYLSGWVVKLFPYIETSEEDGTYDSETGMAKYGKLYTPNPFLYDDSYLLSTLTTKDFPSGFAQIAIIWNNHFTNETKEMEFYAGFFGIKQYADMSLEPNITWAVCEKSAQAVSYGELGSGYEKQEHPFEYSWFPTVQDKPERPAIYHPEQNTTAAAGLNELKTEVLNAIQKKAGSNVNYSKLSVSFVVTSKGSIADVNLSGTKDEKLKQAVEQVLKSLSYTWKPAICPITIMDLMGEEDNLGGQTLNVNSSITLTLSSK